jgi:preprotein translocase subunit SecD
MAGELVWEIGTPTMSLALCTLSFVVVTTQGGILFGEITRYNVDQRLAFIIDGRVSSAPRVLGAICGGGALITGDFTPALERKTGCCSMGKE